MKTTSPLQCGLPGNIEAFEKSCYVMIWSLPG